MSYAVCNNVRLIPGAMDDIAASKKLLRQESKGLLAIYTRDYTKELDCYTFKPSKNKLVNTFYKYFPSIKIGLTEIKKQLFKRVSHGEYSNFSSTVHQSPLELLKNSIINLNELPIKITNINNSQTPMLM